MDAKDKVEKVEDKYRNDEFDYTDNKRRQWMKDECERE